MCICVCLKGGGGGWGGGGKPMSQGWFLSTGHIFWSNLSMGQRGG